MASTTGVAARRKVPQRQVDVVVDASRVFGSLIATTLAQVDPPVTMPQWRVLVLCARRGTYPAAIAEDLAVHPSNATRLVDRLVAAGLVERSRDALDRRQVLITLTSRGRALYDEAMALRRRWIESAMARLDAAQRRSLVTALAEFTEAVQQAAGPDHGSDSR